MLFLRANPEKQMARDHEAARFTRDKLAARLADVGALASERRSLAQRLAKEGAHDGVLNKAETALRVTEDRIVTLGSALAETD